MNTTMIISIVAGLALGLLVAYINMCITRRNLKASNVGLLMGTNAVRMLLDIAALALAYFGSSRAGLLLFPVLIATAVGLSIGGIVLLKIMLNKTKDINDNPQTGKPDDSIKIKNEERGE